MVLSSTQIHDLLPHRYPFLFVDRIVSNQDGQRIEGAYRVPQNHPFLNRLCSRPVLPSLFAVEALGQVAAVCVRQKFPPALNQGRAMGYLVRVDQCSFEGLIHVDQELSLFVGWVASFGPLHKYEGVCRVATRTAVRAALTLHVDL